MAVVATNLTKGSKADDGTNVTASVTPIANHLTLIAVSARNGSSINPTITSITGCNLTWVLEKSIVFDSTSTSRRTEFVYRAMGAAPTAGRITITMGETDDVVWSVDDFSGIDTSGTDGSGAIVQSVTNSDELGTNTSLIVTLAAFGSANNATYGAFGWGSTAVATAGSGFAISAQATNAAGIGVVSEFRNDNDTSVDFSIATASQMGGIAIEIKAAGGAVATPPRLRSLLGVGL